MSVVYRRATTDHPYNKSQVSVLAFKILSRQRELILVAFIVRWWWGAASRIAGKMERPQPNDNK